MGSVGGYETVTTRILTSLTDDTGRMSMLNEMIRKSGLRYLDGLTFEERSPGRYFQREKTDLGHGFRQMYVILAPGVESPIHDHRGEGMTETHLLLYGGGTFIMYDDEGNETGTVLLEIGTFHPVFSTPETTPRHKYVADPYQGSITLALENYSEGH